LNSGWEIKGPFFGMVACTLGIALVLVWLVQAFVGPAVPPELPAEELAPLQ